MSRIYFPMQNRSNITSRISSLVVSPIMSPKLAREKNLRADILVAGLPEHTEPLSDVLLDAAQPRLIIVADSEFPATKRASSQLRERLARRKVSLLYTRFNGAVTLTFDGADCAARALDGTWIAVKSSKNQGISLRFDHHAHVLAKRIQPIQ